MKGQATERLRVSVNDAMDVHGGKAIIEGPQNYMGALYRAVPIGITVEGANIVTRALIQFGQGSIRSHPYVLKEMLALEDTDRERGLDAFDQAFWGHVGHSLAQRRHARCCARGPAGLLAPAPNAGRTTPYYRQLGRYASAFALCVDMALLTMGGDLKRREMISARFADILSELYLAVRRAQALAGRRPAGRRLPAGRLFDGSRPRHHGGAVRRNPVANFPLRPVAWLLRFMVLPFGPRHRGPSDTRHARLRQHPDRAVRHPRPPHRRPLPSARRSAAWRGSTLAFKLVVAVAADARPHAQGEGARCRSRRWPPD